MVRKTLVSLAFILSVFGFGCSSDDDGGGGGGTGGTITGGGAGGSGDTGDVEGDDSFDVSFEQEDITIGQNTIALTSDTGEDVTPDWSWGAFMDYSDSPIWDRFFSITLGTPNSSGYRIEPGPRWLQISMKYDGEPPLDLPVSNRSFTELDVNEASVVYVDTDDQDGAFPSTWAEASGTVRLESVDVDPGDGADGMGGGRVTVSANINMDNVSLTGVTFEPAFASGSLQVSGSREAETPEPGAGGAGGSGSSGGLNCDGEYVNVYSEYDFQIEVHCMQAWDAKCNGQPGVEESCSILQGYGAAAQCPACN
jgi:hypothetical protein